MVNWGHATFGGVFRPTKFAPGDAPFRNENGRTSEPRETSFSQITDGSSKTLLTSEVLAAKTTLDNDWRGDFMNNEGVHRFHTIQPPNSAEPDVISDDKPWFQDDSDPFMPVIGGAFGVQENAARSRHLGGVNAAFCDGSMSFFSNDINLLVWRARGTINGEEVLSQ